MSVEDHTLIPEAPRPVSTPLAPTEPQPRRRLLRRRRPRAPRPHIRWLRLLLVLLAFVVLAGASAVFGILTAVASDLPTLQNTVQFHERVDSYLYDDTGRPIGVLAPPADSVIDSWGQISPYMRDAIVAVEDKRFWTDPGVDIRGIVRAALSDLTGGQHEGGSTIEEEFVKNVLSQEDNRTIFEKLREAGLAFQLVHRWPRAKILVSYLNTIYFGNGANGVEAAARVYFGRDYGYDPADPAGESKRACGDPDAEDKRRPKCASELTPAQAALLATMVANPTQYDPILHHGAALARRNNVVLLDMYQQHYITRHQYDVARSTPLPTQIQPPEEPAVAPYFVSWVRPLIIRALQQDGIRSYDDAQYEALYGGLKIRLTLNLKLQAAAQQVVDAEFPPGANGPTASLVAIDNSDGEVRAMVSGDNNYNQDPFNLATLGYRQPGSAFKLFTLAAAISSGRYGPDSIIDSKPLRVTYPTPLGTGVFNVHNFANEYLGPISLAQATAVSDNSVFTQVGMGVGTKSVKLYAERMGIRSPISTTPAMILGGLSTGVSALDMAHAYETAATGGYKMYNPVLGDVNEGPVGIHSISGCDKRCRYSYLVNRDEHDTQGDLRARPVLTPDVAASIDELLHGPVDDPGGTGTAAAIPGVSVAGKTGTTSNFV
ncbi:MAG: transglycosylase domain-containing protein, partial [Solirubrobacteraceae bacterium]